MQPHLELKQNYFSRWQSSEIISQLLQRQWTCWTIFVSCNQPVTWLWN